MSRDCRGMVNVVAGICSVLSCSFNRACGNKVLTSTYSRTRCTCAGGSVYSFMGKS